MFQWEPCKRFLLFFLKEGEVNEKGRKKIIWRYLKYGCLYKLSKNFFMANINVKNDGHEINKPFASPKAITAPVLVPHNHWKWSITEWPNNFSICINVWNKITLSTGNVIAKAFDGKIKRKVSCLFAVFNYLIYLVPYSIPVYSLIHIVTISVCLNFNMTDITAWSLNLQYSYRKHFFSILEENMINMKWSIAYLASVHFFHYFVV